jgi:hypothetical protein
VTSRARRVHRGGRTGSGRRRTAIRPTPGTFGAGIDEDDGADRQGVEIVLERAAEVAERALIVAIGSWS